MFITFEGIEGSGKSTQIKLLADHLDSLGVEVVPTRDPGGTAIGDRIRALLLDTGSAGMDGKTEALLYVASRAQLVHEVIKPSLAAGKVVLCDRYVDSTVAYQCYARGVPESVVDMMNDWATGGLWPDLTILLNLEPVTGLSRGAGALPDRIESEDEAFHRRVAEGYLAIAESEPRRIVVIDANQPIDDIHRQIKGIVEERAL